MASIASSTPSTIRPYASLSKQDAYRSHKYPACSFCRNRKTRCDFDLPGQPCRLCRERKRTCEYSGNTAVSGLNAAAQTTDFHEDIAQSCASTSRTTKRLLQDASLPADRSLPASKRANTAAWSGLPSITEISPTESSLMMNPHMAEDITVLQQYLTSTSTRNEQRATSKLYSTISTGPGGSPVVYLTLPKRRRGLRNAVDPGRAQREIIENVLGPNASEVRRAYFDHLHPCFPVLDEITFSKMWLNDPDSISSTLVCDLYASALQVWSRSAALCRQTRPDPHFIWNQAVAALQDDFMAPTIATVHAAVLDLLGRPIIGVAGNIVNAGRIVTLAQSLGLHRDPSLWKATNHEKSVRINLWWGVLIHDYWSSIGHGIPPTINSGYYDVPMPHCDDTENADPTSQAQMRSTSTFPRLCKLSQILGDILPLVYSLQERPDHIKRQLRKVECALDDWVLELPDFLQPTSPTPFMINGSSNLWFAYLSIKVLICRLSFKAVMAEDKPKPEARQYWLAMLKDAASNVTEYVTSLSEIQFQEFWMPHTSYLLVTSATILLRCIVESNDLLEKRTCVTRLVAFRNRLRTARDTMQWDLADFCLERCDEPIQKLADALGIPSHLTSETNSTEEEIMPTSRDADPVLSDLETISDLFLPIDSLDYSWKHYGIGWEDNGLFNYKAGMCYPMDK